MRTRLTVLSLGAGVQFDLCDTCRRQGAHHAALWLENPPARSRPKK